MVLWASVRRNKDWSLLRTDLTAYERSVCHATVSLAFDQAPSWVVEHGLPRHWCSGQESIKISVRPSLGNLTVQVALCRSCLQIQHQMLFESRCNIAWQHK